MKPWAKKFYNSRAWKECRAAYIVKVHGLCERCSKPGKIVHHKKYLTPYNINNPNITLSHSNLEYVCQDCHNNEHHGDGPAGQGLMFDDEGNLIQRGERL